MKEPSAKATILLVDDDNFLLGMYSLKFAGAGYTAQACTSGKEALGILRAGLKPDVILFDITMPELDGFAFLKTITDEYLADDALKIALTNQSDDAEKNKAMEMGAANYVVKAKMIPSEVVTLVEAELSKTRSH